MLSNGTAVYSYDQFGSLVSARESGFDTIFQTRDTVGNLYETQDGSDRIYGAGSRLEQSGIDLKERRNRFQGGYGKCVTQGTRYFYDEEGNLARKIEPGGGTWDYEYFGNNTMFCIQCVMSILSVKSVVKHWYIHISLRMMQR